MLHWWGFSPVKVGAEEADSQQRKRNPRLQGESALQPGLKGQPSFENNKEYLHTEYQSIDPMSEGCSLKGGLACTAS